MPEHVRPQFEKLQCSEAEATQENCQNGGSCEKIGFGDGTFIDFCYCVPGYSGRNCQHKEEDCNQEEAIQQACQNEGQCKKNDWDKDGTYYYGYSGLKCSEIED
ncbi:hypothetical protein OS493_027950 [Desmophyllum pertusum]|uniref:EGF-like domain-containing protein n=1 Tax=Desmophyllum pertusum TaxID=174260 RepID=A0A9X0CDI1_9CNID|nr:hypothetical protein OS493_027950 [Desmophyllum pertusum]